MAGMAMVCAVAFRFASRSASRWAFRLAFRLIVALPLSSPMLLLPGNPWSARSASAPGRNRSCQLRHQLRQTRRCHLVPPLLAVAGHRGLAAGCWPDLWADFWTDLWASNFADPHRRALKLVRCVGHGSVFVRVSLGTEMSSVSARTNVDDRARDPTISPRQPREMFPATSPRRLEVARSLP